MSSMATSQPKQGWAKHSIFRGIGLRNGNVVGTRIFPVRDYEAERYSGAHAVVIIRIIEPVDIPIAGGRQLSTRIFVIKNSYNNCPEIFIPEVYNTDEFDRDPIGYQSLSLRIL